MTLLSVRKRADEFDALLDGRSSTRADLVQLASVAMALRDHPAASPRADFAASLREQLMAEAATVLVPDAKSLALPVRRRGTRERRLVAATAAVVLVGGTAGMAAAAQNALPGDTLYPIKRTLERAEAGLNTSDAAKGRELLSQAEGRLAEVGSLLGESGPSHSQVPSTLDDFSLQAQEGAAFLAKSFELDRDPKHVEAVRSFTAENLPVLQELAKTAPPEAQEPLARAALVLADLDARMLDLCSSCAASLPPLAITDVLNTSSWLRDKVEAAARTDDNAVETPAKAGAPVEPPPSSEQKPAVPSAPLGPSATQAPDAGNTVKKTDKGVKSTVDNTVDPVEDLLDDVLPGAGELVGDLGDGLTGGLLGGGSTTP